MNTTNLLRDCFLACLVAVSASPVYSQESSPAAAADLERRVQQLEELLRGKQAASQDGRAATAADLERRVRELEELVRGPKAGIPALGAPVAVESGKAPAA